MKTAVLLLTATVAALVAVQCLSAPCNVQEQTCGKSPFDPSCSQSPAIFDGKTSIEASKSSKSANINSASCDASSREINAKNANGEYNEKSSKSSSKTASASSSESVETYKAYKAGVYPCDDSLPPRECGEFDEAYYKRIFPVNECDKASVKAFYVKVFKQYKGECDCDYVKRIDGIFTKVYKSLDCRLDDEYLCYLDKYYVIKYAKKEGECEQDYFKRVITKTSETEEEYNDKIVILKRYIKTVNWSHIKVNYKSTAGYIYVGSTSTSTGKSLDSGSCSEEVIVKEYARKDCETDEVYFQRIVKKTSQTTTTEEYVKYVSTIRKKYSSLALWYDNKYISLTKEYYTGLYKQQSCEDKDKYYLRIVTKESYETDEQAAKRVECVMFCYPGLELWSNEKYYEKYTKWVYAIIYKKQDCEDETTYFKRVVFRFDKECDNLYVARIDLVVKTHYSLSLWYCDKTYSIVEKYYTIKYNRKSNECLDDYMKRLTQREMCDKDDQIYVQRIHLVHRSTVSCSSWYDDQYYEKYTKTYYSLYYKKGDKEECTTWLIRVITLISGECEDNAIKRIVLINKSKSGCKCWTEENIKKIECSFKKEYITKIRKQFIKTSSVEIKKSSKSSSCSSADASESSSQVSIKN